MKAFYPPLEQAEEKPIRFLRGRTEIYIYSCTGKPVSS